MVSFILHYFSTDYDVNGIGALTATTTKLLELFIGLIQSPIPNCNFATFHYLLTVAWNRP